MASFNQFSGLGRLTRNPELKTFKKGDKEQIVCNFSIAIDRKRQSDVTDFINISSWNKQAELVHQYCKKGDSVFLTGELHINKSDGKVYPEISLDTFQLLTNKSTSVEAEAIGS